VGIEVRRVGWGRRLWKADDRQVQELGSVEKTEKAYQTVRGVIQQSAVTSIISNGNNDELMIITTITIK
jgi:hypothetical protein